MISWEYVSGSVAIANGCEIEGIVQYRSGCRMYERSSSQPRRTGNLSWSLK